VGHRGHSFAVPGAQGGTTFLDGAGGTQAPECVIGAISDAYRCGAELTAREDVVVRDTIGGLTGTPGVRMVGAPTRGTVPTASQWTPSCQARVAARLGERDISVWSGHAYAWELTRALGIRDTGGAIRVCLAPYTADSDLSGWSLP
jgi:selenocysteine lyase/cysteine desulfurase